MSTAASDFPFPHTIGDPSDGDDDLIGTGEGEPGEEDPGALSAEDRLEQMQQRIDEMERNAQREREFYQNALTRTAAGERAPAPDPEDEFTLDDLPDPVENVAEFRKQLSARVKDYTTKTAKRVADDVRSQTSQQQAFNDTWAQFRADHPDLAGKQTLLRAAAMAEIEDLQGRGLDPAAVVQQNSQDFITRVADRMRSELGVSGEDGARKPNTGRTKGASGGSRAAGKGGGGAPKPAGFADQLRKRQAEFGLT